MPIVIVLLAFVAAATANSDYRVPKACVDLAARFDRIIPPIKSKADLDRLKRRIDAAPDFIDGVRQCREALKELEPPK